MEDIQHPMTSDTPPMSPEMQAQAPATAAPGRTNSNRRPWLEPAVVVAVIGVAVTIFGLLLSIVFGIYSMNNHIDALGSELKADVRDLNARVDALGSDFNVRIEQVYQLLLGTTENRHVPATLRSSIRRVAIF